MSNPELFPPTAAERLATVRAHLAAQVEDRHKAVTRATEKFYDARALLEAFDTAMESGEPVAKALADLRRRAAEDGMGVSLRVGNEEPVTLAEAPERYKEVAS